MADDLDEKNKQVKDNFMDEITKIVKKNVSEKNLFFGEMGSVIIRGV